MMNLRLLFLVFPLSAILLLALPSCQTKPTSSEDSESESSTQVTAHIIVKNNSGKTIAKVSFSRCSGGLAGSDGVSIPYGSSRSYPVDADCWDVFVFFGSRPGKSYSGIDMRRGGSYTITVWPADAG